MMLSEMVREGKPPRLQRGVHLASDGIWLEGPSETPPTEMTHNAAKLKDAFDQRREHRERETRRHETNTLREEV